MHKDRIDRDFVGILNILSLLRDKPMTHEELLKSGYFKTRNQLDFALRRLTQSGCIEKIKAVGIYCILGYGITLLSFYPTWRPLPVEVLDIVIPIGEERHG
jgi:hypothetical protein